VIALRSFTAACAVTYAVVALLTMVAASAASEFKGRLAYGSEFSQTWWSRHLDGTGKRPLLHRATDVSFSADGRRLAYVRLNGLEDAGIAVARGNGRDPAWVIRPFDQRIYNMTDAFGVALSPDGTHVAAEIQELPGWDDPEAPIPPGGGWEVNLYLVGADGNNLRLLASDAYDPAWSPDAREIAYISDNSAVEAIAPDGTSKHVLLPPDDAVRRIHRQVKSGLDFSPDGRTLMFRSYSPRRKSARIALADVATGTVRRLPARVTGDVFNAVWCANGRRIAFSAPADPTSRAAFESLRVYTIRADGTDKRLAFTASGRWPSIDGLAWQPPRRARP
jgi:Tol biopolymer transport system component